MVCYNASGLLYAGNGIHCTGCVIVGDQLISHNIFYADYIESVEGNISASMNIVAGRDIQAKGDIICGGKYSVFQNIFQSV